MIEIDLLSIVSIVILLLSYLKICFSKNILFTFSNFYLLLLNLFRKYDYTNSIHFRKYKVMNLYLQIMYWLRTINYASFFVVTAYITGCRFLNSFYIVMKLFFISLSFNRTRVFIRCEGLKKRLIMICIWYSVLTLYNFMCRHLLQSL